MKRAFTLLELLIVICIIAVLVAFSLAAVGKMRSLGQQAFCANSLRQLGVATQLYLADNEQRFFSYSKATPEGVLWYFGLEPSGGSKAEGNRELDVAQSPLYPYIQKAGGIEICRSFPYESALWKPKFKGASYGYGYNTYLSNRNMLTIERPSNVVVFGDCAQVNTFQAPASPKNPMLEEFYMIDSNYKTIHFRHGTSANLLFADGHIALMKMYSGTGDSRLPSANVGRITPVGSMQYLW